jgi:hypothetical protein
MPISYICQSNSSAINSELSKTPNGRALLGYLNDHGKDNDIPTVPASTANATPNQPFSIESLFASRSSLMNSGLGLFAQLLHPQLSENAGTITVGTSDSSDSNAGRAVVFVMRGHGQQPSVNTSSS